MGKDNLHLYIIKKSSYGENDLKIKIYNVVHFIKMVEYLNCNLQGMFFV